MNREPFQREQKGMALVIALVMLLVLTIIGINAINTTVFETSISGNQRLYNTAFYGADGGTEDFRVRAAIDPRIELGTITSYSETIPGTNVAYNVTWTYLGVKDRGGIPYKTYRVRSEGVAPNFPFAGRVAVETIEEIDTSGGGNVAEVGKYN